MTQDDGGYDIRPVEKPPAPAPGNVPLKPGDPGWVPPVPIIEKGDDGTVTPDELPDPDIEKNKGMAILAYIFFIIPLLAAPKSPFAKFHANQGLLAFMVWCAAIIGNIILWAIHTLMEKFMIPPVLSAFFSCIFFLLEPALLVGALALTIYGIIQAANGEKKPLPLIGQITLLK